MADPLTIATSAIALAGTGITIAKSLKAYIDTVRKAEKKLRPVIRDVEVMSGVLTQIGTALENEEIRKLCTAQFFGIAKGALESCTENFQTLKVFNTGLASIDGDEVKMTVSAKLSLFFKQQELDVLRGNMGESKASLNLVIGTLQIVITMRTAPKDSAAVEDLKVDMQHRLEELAKEKRKDTTVNAEVPNIVTPQQRHGDSSFPAPPYTPQVVTELGHGGQHDLRTSETSRALNEPPRGMFGGFSSSNPKDSTSPEASLSPHSSRGMASTARNVPMFSSFAAMQQPRSISGNDKENKRSTRSRENPDGPDRLLDRLQHASRVSAQLRFETLELIDIREAGRKYNSRHLHSRYDEAQSIFASLWAQERSERIVIDEPGAYVRRSTPTSRHDDGLVVDRKKQRSSIFDMFSDKKRSSRRARDRDYSSDDSDHGRQRRSTRRDRSRSRDRDRDRIRVPYASAGVGVGSLAPMQPRPSRGSSDPGERRYGQRPDGASLDYVVRRSRSRSSSGSLSDLESGLHRRMNDRFDTSPKPVLAGTALGGPAGREFTQRQKDRDILLGAVVGGLGANAAESKWQDWKSDGGVGRPARPTFDDDSDSEMRSVAWRKRQEELQKQKLALQLGGESSDEEFDGFRRKMQIHSGEDATRGGAPATAKNVTAVDELLRNWTTLDI